jgi:methylated-DNA-[protein]-cysteine S-methyltransferase
MMELLIDRIDSAIGKIIVVVQNDQLCTLDFADYEARMLLLLKKRYPSLQLKPTVNPIGMRDRLQAYFNGDYTQIHDIPVSTGGTPFQQQVWSALKMIPPGKTISYGELATQLGKPSASRAVGMANSLNPVAIVLPCHRVIGANASLTGYAGGLERKRWLLQHEGVDLENLVPAAKRKVAQQLTFR